MVPQPWRAGQKAGHLEDLSVAQNITRSAMAMVEAAKREIEEIPATEAVKLAGRDDVVLVDIRDIRELDRDGRVPGAFHAPRGMLEFWIDPASPYFKPVFGADKKYVFYCAGGLRSALAAKTAQDMGLKPVAHIIGGFGAWKKAGGPVEASQHAPGQNTAKT
jgi:rhodanese-related sulfurtransferase